MRRMRNKMSIGLIGNYNAAVAAHQAIPLALQYAAKALDIDVGFEWLATEHLVEAAQLDRFNGLWCVPASPYRSMDGALLAIGHARVKQIPFLGTCGGFQHAVVEYARNVLGWADADHAESSPTATRAVITPLECALVEATGMVRLLPGTRVGSAYQCEEIIERYHCRYGLNAEFRTALTAGPLRISAVDAADEVRAIELDNHPFFVATLFQPERAALTGIPAPLVTAFIAAATERN